MNASYHYSFAYFINYTKDFIECNFSIPKYKFGSNVLMFVEHWNDRDFKYYEASTMEYNLNKSFTLLETFLKNFLRNEFILNTIDLKDVEIHRIDVCFNQLFHSREEALLYLEYQKKIKKKYARDEDGVMRDYATSLMYVTKRYSAKIYHKGTEYEKNDLKEHERINQEKGKQYFNTKKFKEFSDKMLRYELTIRNGMLNYLHKHSLFRTKCSWHNSAYKTYLMVENAMQKNERISKKIGSLSIEEKEGYALAHPYEKIGRDSRNIYKEMCKLLTRRRYFVLEGDLDTAQYNSQTVTFQCDNVTFSKGLLKLCLEKLLEFIGDFKVEELQEKEAVKRLIDNYNTRHKGNLPKAEMMHFYHHLLNCGSFKDAAKFTEFSRATLFRYKERFKKIGITDKFIKPVDKISGIPEAKIDFQRYHSTILYDNDLLRGINII
jgi:hypothetical protein